MNTSCCHAVLYTVYPFILHCRFPFHHLFSSLIFLSPSFLSSISQCQFTISPLFKAHPPPVFLTHRHSSQFRISFHQPFHQASSNRISCISTLITPLCLYKMKILQIGFTLPASRSFSHHFHIFLSRILPQFFM